MKWVYDIALVVIFAYIIIRGWRQGILAAVLRLAGWAAALFIIVKFTQGWAQTIYQNYVEATVINAVQAAIPADTVAALNNGADIISTLQSALSSMGGLLGGLLSGVNLSSDSISQLQGVMGLDTYQLAQLITQSVLQPVLLSAVRGGISLLVLLVCVSIFNVLSRVAAKHTGKGVLGRTNQALGAVAGTIQCLGVGFVLGYALQLLAQVLNAPWLNTQLLQSTLLLKVFI